MLNLAEAPTRALNSIVPLALDAPYQTEVHQLNGTVGQRWFFDALENDFENVVARLWAPESTYRYVNGNSDSDVAPFTLAHSGTYYFFVESNLPAATHSRFRILNADDQPILNFDTPAAGDLDPGLGSLLFRVPGRAGLHLFFNATGSVAAGGYWYLYGPNNEGLASAGLNGPMEITLNQAGTALLLLSGNSANPVPYAMNAIAPDPIETTGEGPEITSIAASAGTVTLTWASVPGRTYRVQFKADLTESNWTDLSGDVTANGSTASKTDSTIGNAPRRFYRVQVP